MEILVKVVNQKLKIASNLKSVVAGTQEFISFKFIYGDDWSELTTFAQFTQNGNSYNVYLDENDCCYLPPEIVAGKCTVMLFGTKTVTIRDVPHTTRATTNVIELEITENMLVANASSTEITQTLYDQLVQKVNEVLDLSDSDYSDLIKSEIARILGEYLDNGYLAAATIGDGTIEKAKLNSSLQASIDKADNSWQKNVSETSTPTAGSWEATYDPAGYGKRNPPIDPYSFAQTQRDTAIARMRGISSVAEVNNGSQTFTLHDQTDDVDRSYTGVDSALEGVYNLANKEANRMVINALAKAKEDLSEVEDFFVPIDSGVSVGTLATGSYISPITGANGALACGCRSDYVDIIVSGTSALSDRRVPLMFVAGFDRTIYKYTIYGYSTHGVSSASESFTGGTWTQRERVFILPKNAGTTCFRFSAIRIDGQGTITAEQAAEIASNIKIMRMTDADLAKAGVPADALATREAIAALEAKILPNSAKKIAFFGDSIMWGRDGNGSASTQVSKTIPDMVAEKLGIVATNYGVGGMGWVEDVKQTGINAYEKIADTDLSDFDCAVLAFGVNDGQKPIGEWNSTDETTCAGQINKCIGYLQTEYPELLIIVVAPWNGRNIGTAPDYWYGDVTVIGARYSRQELRNVEARICQNQWIPFIDVYDSPINPASILTALPDGVHPSADYYIMIGEWLAAKIGRMVK